MHAGWVALLVILASCGRLRFDESSDAGNAPLADTLPGDAPDGSATVTCAPATEVCNGIDDDCNDVIDEVCPCPTIVNSPIAAGGNPAEAPAEWIGTGWLLPGLVGGDLVLDRVPEGGGAATRTSFGTTVCEYGQGSRTFAWDGTGIVCVATSGEIHRYDLAATELATFGLTTANSGSVIRVRAGGYDVLAVTPSQRVAYFRIERDGTVSAGPSLAPVGTNVRALDIVPIGGDLLAVWTTGLAPVQLQYGVIGPTTIGVELGVFVSSFTEPFRVTSMGDRLAVTDGVQVRTIDRNGNQIAPYTPIGSGAGSTWWTGSELWLVATNPPSGSSNAFSVLHQMPPGLGSPTASNNLHMIGTAGAFTTSRPQISGVAGHWIEHFVVDTGGMGMYIALGCM